MRTTLLTTITLFSLCLSSFAQGDWSARSGLRDLTPFTEIMGHNEGFSITFYCEDPKRLEIRPHSSNNDGLNALRWSLFGDSISGRLSNSDQAFQTFYLRNILTELRKMNGTSNEYYGDYFLSSKVIIQPYGSSLREYEFENHVTHLTSRPEDYDSLVQLLQGSRNARIFVTSKDNHGSGRPFTLGLNGLREKVKDHQCNLRLEQ